MRKLFRFPNGDIRGLGRGFLLGNTRYPKDAYSNTELLRELGIKDYREVDFQGEYYIKTGETVMETTDEFVVYPDLEPKCTVLQAKLYIRDEVKKELYKIYREAKAELVALQEFDPTSPDVEVFQDFIGSLRAAFVSIMAEVVALSTYQDVIIYQWGSKIPTYPNQEEI